MKINFLIRSFQYRNYRLFFGGQCISQIGNWIQTIAMSWLVYGLTSSALMLGFVGFIGQIPILFFAPLAGVLLDGWNRHRALVITKTLAMCQAFMLAALVLTGKVTITQIIVLSVFLGLVLSFEQTVSQSFVVNIVENKEDLGNAIALNTALFNAARLLGPAVAGILIVIIGEGMCFLINGICFLAIIIALLCMKIKPQKIVKQGNLLKGLKEGVAYVFDSVPMRSIIMIQAFITLVGMPFGVLMPVFVKEILGEGSGALGFIMGCSGLGSIIATFYLATRKDAACLARLIPLSATILGLGLIGSSFSRLPWISMFFALFTGFGAVLQLAAGNTILQMIVDDDKRGRVMSFSTLAFSGVYPLGSLLAGSLGEMVGVPNEFMISGILCLAGALVFVANLGSIGAIINRRLSDIGVPM